MKKLVVGGWLLVAGALCANADIPRVIYDTDIGSSMCDLMGLDMAVRLDQLGHMKLIGVMLDRPDASDPAKAGKFLEFTDRTLVSLGRDDVPLGRSMPLLNADGSEREAGVFTPYWELVHSNDTATGQAVMPPSNRDLDALPDAVALYRRLLNESPSNSVAICAVGFFNNLIALMNSGANDRGDGIPKTGQELIREKVKGLWVMAGCFNNGGIAQDEHGEYNVWTDIRSADDVFQNWPGEIVFSPWEVGLKLEYKPEWLSVDFPKDGYSSVVYWFQKYWGNPEYDDYPNRMWDVASLLNVVVGASVVPLSEPGRVTVEKGSGVTTFTPDANGNCRYQVADQIDAAATMDFFRGIFTTDMSKAIPRIIIDTDIGSSVDDLLAIDLAARWHWGGHVNLIGVMLDRPDHSDGPTYAEGKGEFLKFADAYLMTLNLDNVPLGKAVRDDMTNVFVFTPYWTLVNSNDTATGEALMKGSGRDLKELPDAVTLYRRLLNESPSNSVEICQIGFFGNLMALMESESNHNGDGIMKTGAELIREKVRALRVMAGCFEGDGVAQGGHGEFNVWGDIPSARYIFENWPSPIVCSTWEVGLALKYEPDWIREDFPAGCWNSVMHAFDQYWHVPAETDEFPNRLWDVMTVLGVVHDEQIPVSPRGTIAVDDDGITTFTKKAGERCCYQFLDREEDAAAIMKGLRKIYSDRKSAQLGTKDDPWTCGFGVTASVDGGVLILEGRGTIVSTPWEEKKDEIVEVRKEATVCGFTLKMMGDLPRLDVVNGLDVSDLGGLKSAAADKRFKAIAVDPDTKTAKLTFSVRTAKTLDAPAADWTEVATPTVEVPADDDVGFYLVK